MAKNKVKNKVLLLITKATRGGAQKYVYDLATHLPEEFEVKLTYGEPGALSDSLAEKNISTYQIPSLGRDFAVISDITSFFRILVHIWREHPDIVHLNSSKAAALGALAARIARVPRIVFTVHGWPYKEERPRASRAAIYFLSWLTALFSDIVIVVSKADEVQGHQMAFIGKKITYIPIGIESVQYLSRADAWKQVKEIAGGELPKGARLVTLAELTRNKGLSFALEAAAILKSRGIPFSYLILGEGEEREKLQHKLLDLDITDRVFLPGFIEGAARHLLGFDLFILSSIKEGMPYALVEAAHARLPIVTTRVVNPEFVGTFDRVRAVPPGDAIALADAIEQSLAEKKAEREMFPITDRYDLETMVHDTVRRYAR